MIHRSPKGWAHITSLGGNVKKLLTAGVTALALVASGVMTGLAPANAALRVPKATWPACSVSPGTYCVDSVIVTDARGRQIPLVWVPSGQAAPAAKATDGELMAPMAQVDAKGKVVNNSWWAPQHVRDVLLSGTATYVDGSALIGTANMPTIGAKQDPKTKLWDTTEPMDAWNQMWTCDDPVSKTQKQMLRTDCFKGAVLVIQDGELKDVQWQPQAQDAINSIKWMSANTFVDLKDLAAQQLQPTQGSTYDAKAKTFSKTEPLFFPKWILDQYMIQNWVVPGLSDLQPTQVAALPTDTSTAVAPDTASVNVSTVSAGRALSGRWTVSNWAALGLNSLGYDGLYVDAKAANEFVNHTFVDVNPVLVDANNKVNLAGQANNAKYATNLDPDVTISVKLRTGEIKTGVTVAVGIDTEVQQGQDQYGNNLTITGNPVSVPISASAKDCTGESGVAVANVRQFQTLIVVQNDTAGFGVDGTSGNMYVGSNGVCNLSTPTWNPDNKSFTWQTAAPHFAADGTTVNKGFYKAVIPFQDAALLWGLTNPADAATALTVAVTTEAGGSSAAISVVSAKNNNIVIDVSGFGYSRPKLSIAMKPGYKPSKKSIASLPKAKSTVTCVLGKTTKKITDVKPVCPKGYKKLV